MKNDNVPQGALDIDVLARTIWGEARGEGSIGMQAVANVVMNRALISELKGGHYWWGNSVVQICQRPYQFSCWNKDDPNYRQLLAAESDDPLFAMAIRLSRLAIDHILDDVTKGATHYHAAGISPHWTRNEKPCAVVGRHIFYKLAEV